MSLEVKTSQIVVGGKICNSEAQVKGQQKQLKQWWTPTEMNL